jgi:hypothetical protein
MPDATSALRPTIDELRTIWRYSYAHSALCEAVQYVDLLDQDAANKPENITFRRALMSAMITAYVRPFTQSRIFPCKGGNFVALDGLEPPPGLKEAHDSIVRLRHKTVSHKDASESGMEINKLILVRAAEGPLHIHTITLDGLDAVTCAQLKLLCSHYIGQCGLKLHPILTKYEGQILNYPPGRYEMCLTEAPKPWIKPLQGDGQNHSVPLKPIKNPPAATP